MTDPKTGKAYIQFQYVLRFILTAAILAVAAVVPFIDVMGAVFGIFTLQISVLIVKSIKFPEEPAGVPADISISNTAGDLDEVTDEPPDQ
jgi:hypothetical protein